MPRVEGLVSGQMSQMRQSYESILREIETCDEAIASALERRVQAARALGALRREEPDQRLTIPSRSDVISARQEASESLSDNAIAAVFREVVSACDQLIQPQRIAFLGTEGAFAHVAGIRHFGGAASFRGFTSTELVLEEVQAERCSFAVLPLETSTDGGVTLTLNALAGSELRVVGELTIPCSHYLVAAAEKPAQIEKIYGASLAVGACEQFLRTHFPRALVIDTPSTEVALSFARDEAGAAAVGTESALATHGLSFVHERIEDVVGQEVRFAIIGRQLVGRTGHDRTLVAVAAGDSAGALSRCLQPFADRGVNLTRLESRPAAGEAWRYLFYMELDGHVTDRRVLTALEDIRNESSFVRVLGSFPRPE